VISDSFAFSHQSYALQSTSKKRYVNSVNTCAKSFYHQTRASLTSALAGVDSLAGGFLTPWTAVEEVKAGLRMECWEETPKASAPARKATTERAVKRILLGNLGGLLLSKQGVWKST